MRTAQPMDEGNGPALDLLTHLEEAFGWGEAQAMHALSAYVWSTEAGRVLYRELDAVAVAAA